jgi:hypothetical protein
MKGIKLFVLITLGLVACKENKNEGQIVERNSAEMGKYEAVFIDVKDTLIRENIDRNVLKDDRLLMNINLVNPSEFWGKKNDFVVFAMGSIKIPENGKYYFRLTNSGKIVLKLNNKDLVAQKKVQVKETKMAEAYLEKGFAIFEYEYYPAFQDPYLVLEWSTDGKEYEVIPNDSYNNLDAFSVENWTDTETNAVAENSPDNTLSVEEKKKGWKLLFDGKTTSGWHTYNKPGTIGRKWIVKDGALVFDGRHRFEFFVAGRKIELGPVNKALDGGEDIVSDKSFENFELTLEWKISEAGNNGIFYTVQEDVKYNEIWKTSPEMQVMDNQKHKDGLIEKHRAGDLYDLISADPIRVKPQGEWNKVRIIKNKGKIEHWLNGTKVLSYDVNSEAWKDMISKSKFSTLTEFASSGPGKIGFQDHDNAVYYKNIKIKEIK